MLRSLKDLEQYTVSAMDGDLGTVVDVLLDDERWTIRYLVVDTGSFLGGHQVLISPISFREVDGVNRRFHLALTIDKIRTSPGVDVDKPVSRQHERELHRYYGYPNYWGDAGLWGMGASPSLLTGGPRKEPTVEVSNEPGDSHLRSAKEVRGYHIQGSDDAIGHAEDFIVNDETWEIRYLVVDTSNWWFGKKVLVAPHWAKRVDWSEQTIHIDLTQYAIKNSPLWSASAGINREFEEHLYDYYGRPVYWDRDGQTMEEPFPHQIGLTPR